MVFQCATLPAEAPKAAQTSQQVAGEDAGRLVREVVYNEMHDHDTPSYWRYWIQRHAGKETEVQEQVETTQGPVQWLVMSNGHPVSAETRASEEHRLQRLLHSSSEQAQHRKAYAEDEQRVGRILALLPEAFDFDTMPIQELPGGPCYHLRFRPKADYAAHSIEQRVFHAMAGDVWISVQSKRLVRLEGRLQENVDFGFGILGRLYKDGWFRMDRTRVSSGPAISADDDWKTQRLEVHMIGRAVLFKTIARETSEVRGGFVPVPPGLTLEEAAEMIRLSSVAPTAEAASLTSIHSSVHRR
jgi:hypothetical protein